MRIGSSCRRWLEINVTIAITIKIKIKVIIIIMRLPPTL